jgi:proteasome lid subunit RPN8/RPN11
MARSDIRACRVIAALSGLRMAGTFHSHPIGLARPTASDLRIGAIGQLQLIFDVWFREARLWRTKKGEDGRMATEVSFRIG